MNSSPNIGKRQVKSSFALQNLVSLTPTPVERTGKVAPVYQYNEQLEYVSYTKGELRVMLSRGRIHETVNYATQVSP